MNSLPDQRPLILHVMYRLDTGGLENGVVNLINHMPPEAYRHAVLALTEVTEFSKRITRTDVEFVSLRKSPGHGVWQYPKLYQLFRELRPAVVHTRNLAALEAVIPAWAARVPALRCVPAAGGRVVRRGVAAGHLELGGAHLLGARLPARRGHERYGVSGRTPHRGCGRRG